MHVIMILFSRYFVLLHCCFSVSHCRFRRCDQRNRASTRRTRRRRKTRRKSTTRRSMCAAAAGPQNQRGVTITGRSSSSNSMKAGNVQGMLLSACPLLGAEGVLPVLAGMRGTRGKELGWWVMVGGQGVWEKRVAGVCTTRDLIEAESMTAGKGAG
jgi:hypothetical protein